MKGKIIEESLENNEILKKFKISNTQVTDDENLSDRWHIHTVEINESELGELKNLAKFIKPKGWYAHFWNEEGGIIAVFKDRIFSFNYYDKKSWKEVINHGLSVGIPKQQLDFLID